MRPFSRGRSCSLERGTIKLIASHPAVLDSARLFSRGSHFGMILMVESEAEGKQGI